MKFLKRFNPTNLKMSSKESDLKELLAQLADADKTGYIMRFIIRGLGAFYGWRADDGVFGLREKYLGIKYVKGDFAVALDSRMDTVDGRDTSRVLFFHARDIIGIGFSKGPGKIKGSTNWRYVILHPEEVDDWIDREDWKMVVANQPLYSLGPLNPAKSWDETGGPHGMFNN